MGGEVVVDLHKPNGDEAVEPGVGDFLHDVLVGGRIVGFSIFLTDGLHQLAALADGLAADGIGRPCADVVELRILGGLRKSGLNALIRDSQQSSTVTDIVNELVPRPYGEILDGCFVHTASPYNSRANSSACSRACFAAASAFFCAICASNASISPSRRSFRASALSPKLRKVETLLQRSAPSQISRNCSK